MQPLENQIAMKPQAPVPPPQQAPSMPLFWYLLNDADKEAYSRMRLALSSPACKHRRHHSNELNREIVQTIKNFVIRNDGDDWKRALVSGIVWLPNAIAINTRQLRLLLSKCKSSINALFQNMGYVTIPTTNDYSSSLITFFPLLRDNFTELRKWTIRLSYPLNNNNANTNNNNQQGVAKNQQLPPGSTQATQQNDPKGILLPQELENAPLDQNSMRSIQDGAMAPAALLQQVTPINALLQSAKTDNNNNQQTGISASNPQ